MKDWEPPLGPEFYLKNRQVTVMVRGAECRREAGRVVDSGWRFTECLVQLESVRRSVNRFKPSHPECAKEDALRMPSSPTNTQKGEMPSLSFLS